MFTVSPVTWEDIAGAQENQLVLNHQFNNQLDKVKLIDTYVRAAVNEGTAIIRVGWNYRDTKRRELVKTYDYVECPEPNLEPLYDAINLVLNDPSQKQNLPEHVQRSIDATAELS